MPLYLIADKLDELPESLRSGAKDQNGKFISSLGNLDVDDVRGLKSAVAAERRARKLLESKLKEFDWTATDDGTDWSAEGIDPAMARDLLEKHKSGGLKSTKEIEDFKAQIKQKFERDAKEQEHKYRTVGQQLKEVLIDREAMQAIQAHGGSLRLLLPVVKNAARIEEDTDGKSRVVLIGDDGKPLITGRSGSTEPMGFGEYVEGLKRMAEFKPAFSSFGAGGSGSSSQHGGSARAGIGGNAANLSAQEMIQLANDRLATGIR